MVAMERRAPADMLLRGREAFAGRAWADAFDSLVAADEVEALGPGDLEALAWSAALTGRDRHFIAVGERLYEAHLEANASHMAARWAFWVGLRLFSLGESGRASGWLSRAHRLVDGADCAEHGYLLIPEIHRLLAMGDNQNARRTAQEAIDLGGRFGEPDLMAFARALQGRAVLRLGDMKHGIALLDEAMLAGVSGQLLPLVTGLVYCSVIASCQQAFALDRCREWTNVLATWTEAQPQLVTFNGTCLVHRAEVMQLSGNWGDSISEVRRVAEMMMPDRDLEATADAFYQEAEIFRLRGDFVAAESAYASANQYGREPQPGLALLRLAQKRFPAAASGIRRALSAAVRPEARARLLPALVEIMVASENLEEAASACDELEGFARDHANDVTRAIAEHARGMVILAGGDAAGALPHLREAFGIWQHFGAPYLAARIRVLVGEACRRLGDHDGAALEFAAARSVFETLEAAPDLASLDGNRERAHHLLTLRELQVLRLLATGKTNRAIATELALSEKTIDRHVSNIFNKIDVPSRAAATAFAYEHGLV